MFSQLCLFQSPVPVQMIQEDIQPTFISPELAQAHIIQEDAKVEAQRKIEEEELRKETDSPRRSITPNAANGQ